MERHSLISPEVLARYAADAALGVDGVEGLADGGLHRGSGVEITGGEGSFSVRLELELEWGRSAAAVGGEVQRSVLEYLERMTGTRPSSVEVVVAAIGAPPAKR